MPQPFGQHFLKNKKILQRIAQALELKDEDIVIEIGPGHGELTDEIISASLQGAHSLHSAHTPRSNLRIIAIEKDRELAATLKEKYKNDKNFNFYRPRESGNPDIASRKNLTTCDVVNIEIVEGDALKILKRFVIPAQRLGSRTTTLDSRFRGNDSKIVGNIPYYITGKLLRILSELENKPQKIVLLMQKEVAQRICAPKYNQKMNLLALATQFYADVKILFYVSAGNFVPPPKVDSAVIEIAPRLSSPRKLLSSPRKRGSSVVVLDSRRSLPRRELALLRGGNDKKRKNDIDRGNDSENFFKIIHYGFAKKRKFLISNLSIGLKIPKKKLEEIFEKIGIDFKSRAENLSLEDWKSLTRKL